MDNTYRVGKSAGPRVNTVLYKCREKPFGLDEPARTPFSTVSLLGFFPTHLSYSNITTEYSSSEGFSIFLGTDGISGEVKDSLRNRVRPCRRGREEEDGGGGVLWKPQQTPRHLLVFNPNIPISGATVTQAHKVGRADQGGPRALP